MDDIVKQALRKWPNVPACYGWLGLDKRGQWWLRDEAAQQAGSFLQSKGMLVEHEKLLSFIARNYEVDARGCWFFQNGPQRVFVELELAPMVWRVQPDGSVHSHTGQIVPHVDSVWVDEMGHVYAQAGRVLGVVHAQDVLLASELIEQAVWEVQESTHAALAAQFGFVCSPLLLAAPDSSVNDEAV